jgi:TPR repeat protein
MLRVLLIVLSFGGALPVSAGPAPAPTYEQGMTALEANDYPSALRIFRKVAATKDRKQKYRRAHYQLALMYLNGTGVKKNEREAYREVGLAADYNGTIPGDGFANAIYLQGTMVRDGIGVKRNYTAARFDFKKATNLGHKLAAYEFAQLSKFNTIGGQRKILIREGRVSQLMYMLIARVDGDKRAEIQIEQLCKSLAPDEISEATDGARDYFKWDVGSKIKC